MSTIDITYTNVISGVAADADSVTFSDPTATFGLIRKDNSQVIIAAGVALTRLATGVYNYAFTDPAPGLFYRYYLKVVNGASNVYVERETSIEQAAVIDVTGRYASYTGTIAKFGRLAINKWAQVNGSDDQTATLLAITNAINMADAFVDTYLYGGPYTVPFTDVPLIIKECANILAGCLLYEAQGVVDFDPETEPTNRFSGMKRQAITELGRIKTARVRLISDAGVDLLQSQTYPEAGDCPYQIGLNYFEYPIWTN